MEKKTKQMQQSVFHPCSKCRLPTLRMTKKRTVKTDPETVKTHPGQTIGKRMTEILSNRKTSPHKRTKYRHARKTQRTMSQKKTTHMPITAYWKKKERSLTTAMTRQVSTIHYKMMSKEKIPSKAYGYREKTSTILRHIH